MENNQSKIITSIVTFFTNTYRCIAPSPLRDRSTSVGTLLTKSISTRSTVMLLVRWLKNSFADSTVLQRQDFYDNLRSKVMTVF